jgi:hypothetical protein
VLHWDTLISDENFERHQPLGLWLEAYRLGPFFRTRRYDGSLTRIVGAAPYGIDESEWVELTIAHREKIPLLCTVDTEVYSADWLEWTPVHLLRPGDEIIVPERDFNLPGFAIHAVKSIRRASRGDGLEQARQVRCGTLFCDPKGSYPTPAAFVRCVYNRCALQERP